jgi:mannose-6-phosphate isomerase-like protein (cupin superfamily)
MYRVNQNDLTWDESTSPKGTFKLAERYLTWELHPPEVKEAMRADKKDGPRSPIADLPYDIGMVKVMPGAANYPFHSHRADWECYIVLSGTGTLRHGEERSPLKPGDCVLCPPGEAHQIINDCDEDLVYYVIANNAPTDFWHYPDSGKWGIPGVGYFRPTKLPYFEGEE